MDKTVVEDEARREMSQVRCKDDVTNPYDADNPDWTPTNLQLRYTVEDLMRLVGLCMGAIHNLTADDDIPTIGRREEPTTKVH